jgi:hypothetical protein
LTYSYVAVLLMALSFPALSQALPNYELHSAMRHAEPTGSREFRAILVDRKTDTLSLCTVVWRGTAAVHPKWTGNCGKISGLNIAGLKDSTVLVEFNDNTSTPVGFAPYNPIWIVHQGTGKVKACGFVIGPDSASKDGCVHLN